MESFRQWSLHGKAKLSVNSFILMDLSLVTTVIKKILKYLIEHIFINIIFSTYPYRYLEQC